jgi:hypothetical protein
MYWESAKNSPERSHRIQTRPGETPQAITLNDMERRLAITLARAWIKYDDTINYPDTINGLPPLVNNAEAIGAELAYCRLNNIYPNLNLNGFETHDCILADGTKVNVKFSRYTNPNYHLIVQIKKYDTYPDIYALMVGKWPTYRYIGYVPKHEVIRPERINRDLPVPAYAYPRKYLQT